MGDLNTLINGPVNQTESTQDILAPTELVNQIDLTGIYRTFHLNPKECTFFSSPYGTFSKFDHILRHKASLNKYKGIEITP